MYGIVAILALLCSASLSVAAGAEPALKVYSAVEGRYVMTEKLVLTGDEWRRKLTPEQFHVLREEGTERAFSHPLDKERRPGVYRCAGCDLDLFASAAKFDSGTGWPSFRAPLAAENVRLREDNSLFMRRVEVRCARCDGHLGHVFDDGPPPEGKRYCMNGVALNFVPSPP